MSLLKRNLPILFLIVFSLFIFAPVLFFGKAFSGEEDIGFHYAISYYVGKALASDISLMWIPYYFGGVPSSLDQFYGAWYPPALLLFSLFDFFTAHHLLITLATAAGLILSYMFGRAQGWKRSTSLCLALFYFSATTYEWIWVGTNAAHSFALLPGLLLALHVAATRKTYVLPILLGGIALGVGFLAGFMQIVFYDFVIAGLYALYLDWTQYSRETSFLRNFRISYTYSGITIIGLVVGFLQFYPSAAMIDLTIRTSSYAAQHAIMPFPTELIAFVLPPLFSVPFFGGGGAAGFFITTIGLICAFLALRYYRTPAVVFFAGTYALFMAFAWHLPIFGWINEHIPPFSHMGGNFRWTVGAAFPLAFLGAAGLEGLFRDPSRIPQRARKIILAVSIAIPLLAILGSLIISFASRLALETATMERLISWYTNGRTLSFPIEHYLRVLTTTINDFTATFSLSSPNFFFGVVFACMGAVFFYIAFFRTVNTLLLARTAVVLITIITAGTIVLQWDKFVPQSVIVATKSDLITFVKSHEQNPTTYRIFGYLLGDGAYLQLVNQNPPTSDEIMTMSMQAVINNSNMYFDVQRMDGMEPYRTLRHNHILDIVIAYGAGTYAFDDESLALQTSALDQLYNRDVQKKVTIEEKLLDLPKRLPLLSMMNVKYIYSPFKLIDPSLKQVTEVPVGKDFERYKLYMYENTRVLPRIYVAKEAQFPMSEREALLAVAREKDFAKRTWIECAGCESASGNAEITITKYDPGNIEVTVDAQNDTWLIISESNYPGWMATIDGAEIPIYTANYLFQSVRVPKGEHLVIFTYEDIAVQKVRSIFGQ